MILKKILISLSLSLFLILPINAKDLKMKKVLFVVTSHDKKGDTGEKTGYYLSEVSHPWHILKKAGFEIDFVSPKGGKPPVDGYNIEDKINKEFIDDTKAQEKINNSMIPDQVKADDYQAIFYAGGHGAMWDFADNQQLAKVAGSIYDNGGVVGAVCHGPAGLVNIKLNNGKYLVDGKTVSAFTNQEEEAVGLTNVVPFLLEAKLIERGAIHKKSANFQEHVEISERLVTGQNPSSATKVGEGILSLLK